MKQKSNINPLALIIALIVIALLVKNSGLMSTMGGASVLSISQAKFISSDPELNYSDAYLVDMVANNGGEYLYGEVTPSTLSKYGITSLPSGSFKVKIRLYNVTCNYNIHDDNKPIYKIYQASVRYGLNWQNCKEGLNIQCPYDGIDLNTVKEACLGEWKTLPKYTGYGATWHGMYSPHYPQSCDKYYPPTGTNTPAPGASIETPLAWCKQIQDIQSSPINPHEGWNAPQAGEWCYAMPAEILYDGNHWQVTHIGGLPIYEGYQIDTTPLLKYNVQVILQNDNGTTLETTLNQDKSVAFLGDVARVKFTGNFLANQFCSMPAVNKAVVQDIHTKQFKLVKKEDYDGYNDNLFELINFDNNYFQYVRTDPGVGADVLWEKMSALNSRLRNMYTYQDTSNCKVTDMKLSCTPSSDIFYPSLQMIVKADWLGAYLTSSTPSIQAVYTNNTYYSGDVNYVKATISNTGSETSSYDIYLDCLNSIGLGTQRVSLKPEESKTVILPFTADTGKYSCSVVVSNVNNPELISTKKVTLVVKQRPVSSPESCKIVSKQPCVNAQWQGYPICKWSTQNCIVQPRNNFLKIALILGAIFIFITFMGRIKRR